MDFFQGKTAIVTGAGSGIGRALALALADAGTGKVIITDIIQERIDQVTDELRCKGVETEGYLVDHSKLEEVRSFADRFFERWGHVDILCSNAGVGLGGRFLETSMEEWEWVVGINFWGAIYMLNAFVPRMVERRQGSILLTASDCGVVPLPFSCAYNATKFAVVAVGETILPELNEHNVKLSMLCPGDIKTNVIRDGKIHVDDRAGRSNKDLIEKYYEDKGADPAVVAAAALRGLERDKAIIIVPWIHHGPFYLLYRISPWLYNTVIRLAYNTGLLHRMQGLRR